MHARSGRLVASVGVLVTSGLIGVGPDRTLEAQSRSSRVLVLDQQARTLSALALPSGRVEQTTTLQGTPLSLLRTADGQRLLVLDRGEGRDAGDNGYQARTRAAVTIVDGRTLAVRGRVELGWGLAPDAMLSAAGDRLTVVGPGFRSRKPAELLPREVVTVDLAAATVLSRIELPRPATASLATPDGRTAVVLSAREAPRNAPALPAELRFLDLTAGTITATVPLEGDPGGPVLTPDGTFLYLLDRGKPDDHGDKNVNGRLHAVSMATRTVQVTDAGSRPLGLVLDEPGRQLLLLSVRAPAKGVKDFERPGELRYMRNGVPSAPIAVGGWPEELEVSADGASLYVKRASGLTRLTLPGLEVAAPLVEFPQLVNEMAISRDGRRAYLLNGEYFTTADAQTGQKIESVRTGRMGKKMFLALHTALKTEASRSEGKRTAQREGKSYYRYTEYTLREPRGTMALRPDGKAVYALNSQTSDVTVIDAESGVVLQKVPAGGFAVQFMPAAGVALVPSDATVHVVDLATHQKRPNLITDSNGQFDAADLSPDAKVAVISGAGGVFIVDATSGTPVGTMKAFQRAVDVVVEWAGR
ncbi:MAG: YncE family protein [Vicinamibacterales bacterium]